MKQVVSKMERNSKKNDRYENQIFANHTRNVRIQGLIEGHFGLLNLEET